MSKKRIFYLVFFSVLVVGFLTVLSFVIPGFGKTNLPPIGKAMPFSFINQDGARVTEKDIKGKVVVVEYFFTTCTGICPRMNNNIKKIYTAFKDEADFVILSHTSDPERDSAARLKAYADSLGVNTAKWIFLTGSKDSLYFMARHSYKIDDPSNNVTKIEDDFLHTQFIALVNQKGEVVRIYDALKESEMESLEKKISTLLKN